MRRLVVALCFALVCVVNTVDAQEWRKQKRRYVVVPPEIALVAIANQPGCPVQFENVRVLADLDGGSFPDFQLRNRGSKPIRSLTYEWLTPAASGGGSSWPTRYTDEVVMPGQLAPLGGEDDGDEIVPLTDELRDKRNLRGPMHGVVVLIIVKVTFTDGTTYDAGPTAKALQDYFMRVAGFEEEGDDVKKPKQ